MQCHECIDLWSERKLIVKPGLWCNARITKNSSTGLEETFHKCLHYFLLKIIESYFLTW